MQTLINAQLAATSDMNLVQSISAEPNAKIIFVGDPAGFENIINYYRMIPATVLVPDYAAMEADINGDYNEFLQKYTFCLQSVPAINFFVTIIAALNQGRNILLFFPPEAGGLKYPTALLEYIFRVYGIQTRTEQIPFMFNENYAQYNIDLLYSYNIIGPAQYLLLSGDKFTMVNKLIQDLRIITTQLADPNAINLIRNELNEYRLRMENYGGYLERPFSREVK